MFPLLLIGAGALIVAMVAASQKKETETPTGATPGATGIPAPGSVWQFQFKSQRMILPSEVQPLRDTYAGMAQMAGQTLVAFNVVGAGAWLSNSQVIAVVRYGQQVAPVQIGQQVQLGDIVLTLVSATPAPIG